MDCLKSFAPIDLFSKRRIRVEKSPVGFWLTVIAAVVPLIVFFCLLAKEPSTETSVEINQDLVNTSILISGSYYQYSGGVGNGTHAYKLFPEVFKNPLSYSSESFQEAVRMNVGPTNISVVDALGKFDAASNYSQCLKYRFTSTSSDSYCDWLDCQNTTVLSNVDVTPALSCSVPYVYDDTMDCFICTAASDGSPIDYCYDPSLSLYLEMVKQCVNTAAKIESARAKNYYFLNVYTRNRSLYNKAIGPISYAQLAFTWAVLVLSSVMTLILGNIVVTGTTSSTIVQRAVRRFSVKTHSATSKEDDETNRPRQPTNSDQVNPIPLEQLDRISNTA